MRSIPGVLQQPHNTRGQSYQYLSSIEWLYKLSRVGTLDRADHLPQILYVCCTHMLSILIPQSSTTANKCREASDSFNGNITEGKWKIENVVLAARTARLRPAIKAIKLSKKSPKGNFICQLFTVAWKSIMCRI